MLHKLRVRVGREEGFTLVELLVVIMIIGILAAIALPSFINQKGKADDAQSKIIARTAQTAMETYATNNGGGYANATVSILNSLDPALVTASTSAAYLSAVAGATSSFEVTAYNPITSNTFVITNDHGVVSRSCTAQATGGCPAGGTW